MTMSTVAPPDEDIQVPVPELLGRLLDLNGSDLHLTAGSAPVIRVNGRTPVLFGVRRCTIDVRP